MEKIKNISDILPYTAITDDTIVCNRGKEKTVSAVFEIDISEINHPEIMQYNHLKIMSSINEFPANTYVQIYYIKTFENKRLQPAQNSNSDIINYLERLTIKSFNEKLTPTYKNYMSITIEVPKKKINDSVDIINSLGHKNKKNNDAILIKKAKDRLNMVIRKFSSSIDGVFRLDSAQITQFISLLMNKKYMEEYSELSNVFKSDYNYSVNKVFDRSKAAYIYYGNKFHTVLSQRANDPDSKLPEYSSIMMNDIFNNKDLKEHDFIIQHTIKVLSKPDGIAIAKRRENGIAARGMLASKFTWLSKTPEGMSPEALKELVHQSIEMVQDNSNCKFLMQSFKLHLWADTLDQLDDKYDNVSAVVYTQYPMKREKYNLKAAYFSQFPGFEYIDKVNVCLDSEHVSNFMPIDKPRMYYPTKDDSKFIHFYTKEEQHIKYDPFSESTDNSNAMVIGGSGSGKSFTVNNILYQYAAHNPQIAIIDYGGEGAGSYKNFTENQNGTYLEISMDSDMFSINPFEGFYYGQKIKNERGYYDWIEDPEGEPVPQQDTAIMATLVNMIKNTDDEIIPANIKYELNQCVKRYYKTKNNNKDDSCVLAEFAELELKENKVFKDTEWDLYKNIYQFIGEGQNKGIYANFFKKSKEIKSTDVVCFDLAGLDSEEKLKRVLVPALLNTIQTKILADKKNLHRKKMLIMDEAWQDLNGGEMGNFMEVSFRTIRKLMGQITIITQSYRDVLNSPIRDALMKNTSYYYFVGNNHERKDLQKAKISASTGAVTLSDYEIDLILGSKSKQDFYFLSPFFSGLLSLYPLIEFIMLATTNPEHKVLLRKHMAKLCVQFVTPEVIESAKTDFFDQFLKR